MAAAQSRVVIQFVGEDQSLSSTAGTIGTQLGTIAANAATLTARLGELSSATQSYTTSLKSTSTESERLFQSNARLAGQRLRDELAAQSQASTSLSAALRAQQAEAERIFQTNARLSQQRLRQDIAEQAQAERELAAAQRTQQAEAERIFQTNARLTQQRITQELEQQKQGYQSLAIASGVVATGILGLGKSALDAETKLNAAQAKVSTIAGDSTELTKVLRGVSDDLKNQVSTTDLLAGSYDVLSSGFTNTKDAAEIAKQAVIGATAGFSDANTVGNALTSTLNAYKLGADSAASVTDKLVATQNAGKITVDEYAREIGKLAPLAAQSGVNLDELNGFIATATLSGVRSESAFTGLRQGISAILKPSSDAKKEADQLGIAFDAQALKTKGLSGILAELRQRGADTPEVLLKLFGSVEAVAAIAPSAGEGFKKLQENIEASKNSAGTAREAFDKVASSLESQTKQTLNKFNEALTVIGANIGPSLAVGVKAAGELIDVFLKLPAPVQSALIATTAFAGVLAAAVAAVTAFKLAQGEVVIETAVETASTIADTIATNANAAAKLLAAAATGTLTEAQEASVSSFVEGAAKAGLFAGAIAAIGLAVDTFQKVNAAANETRATLSDFEKAQQALNEAELKSSDASTQKAAALGLEAAANKRIQDSLGGVQQALDVVRETLDRFSLRGLLSEFAKLDAVPQPIKDLINGLVNALPKIGTAAEAAANNAKVAFNDVLGSADAVESQFKKLFQGGLGNATKEQIAGLNQEIAASIAAIEKSQPADAEDVKAKQLRIDRLKELQRELSNTGKAETSAAQNTGDTAKQENTVDRKAEGQKEAESLRESRQNAKVKEDEVFQDSQREKQQAFADRQREEDQAYQDTKQKRQQDFQDQQAAIDRKNQADKQSREQAFQDQQAAIDRKNQADKQSREQTFQEQQQRAEAAFKDDQRKRDEALKKTQSDAGDILKLEGARGKDRINLLAEQQTKRNVEGLNDAALQGKDGQPLSAADLAALAKRSAGVGQIRNQQDEARAQEALRLITERQNKLQKEQERKEDEAFKLKQRAEEQKFKAEEQKRDLELEKQKRDRELKFKQQEEAADLKLEQQKRDRERKFKAEQDAADRKHEADKRAAQQKFEADQKDAERKFKEDQRQKDRANAEAVKRILESIKIQAPTVPNAPNTTTPPPTARFAGGSVQPGVTYLGGERGPERLTFDRGGDTLIGQRGPQLFQVDRPGRVFSHNSTETQQYISQGVVQMNHAQARSPVVNVQPGATVYRDEALIGEIQALRRQVEDMRPIVMNQNFDIESREPMDQVYAATKMAARIQARGRA